MSVIDEIAAERKRQIEVEGWSIHHDDEHDTGDLAVVAAGYALCAADVRGEGESNYHKRMLPQYWPPAWSIEWWRPKNPRRDLIRAAALLVAEIERLDRTAKAPA